MHLDNRLNAKTTSIETLIKMEEKCIYVCKSLRLSVLLNENNTFQRIAMHNAHFMIKS